MNEFDNVPWEKCPIEVLKVGDWFTGSPIVYPVYQVISADLDVCALTMTIRMECIGRRGSAIVPTDGTVIYNLENANRTFRYTPWPVTDEIVDAAREKLRELT